ncbi:hypothetical protein LK08_25685 [Streptomyces sp. MUSC 125]|uniref:hypothetical protein n=1 Tax=Streptomyces sp. MUSC 125 TaxID=1428624 RepID=UPI00057E7863|nr:hypothetical protein [Streptomyces sp. MUSC 125]KIE24288.1 hypothetical protein LK08_25685 [Streptomyces sp. MUSC 125]
MSGTIPLLGRGWRACTKRLDDALLRLATRRHRLIGTALLRIVIGFATILYCLSDYSRRHFLWGPDSYNSISTAKAALPRWNFSLFLWGHSDVWFEIAFHAVILVSAAFMVFGGRLLTLAQAVMMWSLHMRNQDVLEGGDNLAQILILFMVFTVSDAYFAPGAKRRRARMREPGRPSASVVLHNLAVFLIVFQTAVLYFAAGYWKITGKVWQDGVAMYYISRLTGFQMSSAYAHLMNNAFLGTAISYFTIFIELALPFAILSARSWIRKANTLALEGMHVGIMAGMGLVCFGLLMIGADFTCLRDDDYRSIGRRFKSVRARLAKRAGPLLPARALAPMMVGAGGDGAGDA